MGFDGAVHALLTHHASRPCSEHACCIHATLFCSRMHEILALQTSPLGRLPTQQAQLQQQQQQQLLGGMGKPIPPWPPPGFVSFLVSPQEKEDTEEKKKDLEKDTEKKKDIEEDKEEKQDMEKDREEGKTEKEADSCGSADAQVDLLGGTEFRACASKTKLHLYCMHVQSMAQRRAA